MNNEQRMSAHGTFPHIAIWVTFSDDLFPDEDSNKDTDIYASHEGVQWELCDESESQDDYSDWEIEPRTDVSVARFEEGCFFHNISLAYLEDIPYKEDLFAAHTFEVAEDTESHLPLRTRMSYTLTFEEQEHGSFHTRCNRLNGMNIKRERSMEYFHRTNACGWRGKKRAVQTTLRRNQKNIIW